MTDELQDTTENLNGESTQAKNASEESAPNLTVNDLKTMFQIIQVCSTRAGAFHVSEYATVGDIYNKLFAFLKAAGAITVDNPSDSAEAEDDAQESTSDD